MNDRNDRGNGEDESPESWDAPEDAEIVDDDEEKDLKSLILRRQSISYSGRVPPPEWMEYYERIVPGSAKQMMDDAHEESRHRRQMTTKEVDATILLAGRGQWMGFIIGMVGILGGFGLAFLGISLSGGIGVALTGLAALAAVYVTGNWRAAQEYTQDSDRTPARQDSSETEQ